MRSCDIAWDLTAFPVVESWHTPGCQRPCLTCGLMWGGHVMVLLWTNPSVRVDFYSEVCLPYGVSRKPAGL